MKTSILFALALLSGVALRAADSSPPAPAVVQQTETESSILRRQRDFSVQQFQEAQLALILAQQQVKDLTAKVAELQKQIDDAKPKPAAKKS